MTLVHDGAERNHDAAKHPANGNALVRQPSVTADSSVMV